MMKVLVEKGIVEVVITKMLANGGKRCCERDRGLKCRQCLYRKPPPP